MFMFNVFSAIVLVSTASFATAVGQPGCSVPSVVNVPMSKAINIPWYVFLSTVEDGDDCKTLTIASREKSKRHVNIISSGSNGYVKYYWTNYDEGIMTLTVGQEVPVTVLSFEFYSEKPTYKAAVLYNCLDTFTNNKTVLIVASANNIPQNEVNAMKQQVIEAEPSLADVPFYSVNQSNCIYEKHE